MCIDETWIRFFEAAAKRKVPPTPPAVAVGYFLQGGPGDDSQAPHVGILAPDVQTFAGIATHRSRRGPWVMLDGTPFEHLMVPAPLPNDK